MSRTTRVLVVIFGAVLLAAAVPTFSTAADKFTSVFIANTDDQPVPTKAIGTTGISGPVTVPDGVNINGPVTVETAPPERYNKAIPVLHDGSGGEACTPLDVPEGKTLVLEAVHFLLNSGDLVNTYLRQVTSVGEAGLLLDRFRPTATTGNNARLEGPFIGDEQSALWICGRESVSARTISVGYLE